MSISKAVLGMNARNFIYIGKLNSGRAKRLADDKIATKKILTDHGVPTATILGICENRKSALDFEWQKLPPHGFVVKPSRGYGGEGIKVIESWNKDSGLTVNGKLITKRELTSHLFDIFDGAYSLHNVPDHAYFEERIHPAKIIENYESLGLPDIRVIVMNKVPIMAMLRLPTEESEGKANLHQGAIGFGISIRTGRTFHAIYKRKAIDFIPGTEISVQGIMIPEWRKILLAAVECQELSGLGYAGVDIVIDKNIGPLVLEINARPGLDIQLANSASLRTRLERVEGLSVQSAERGVEVGNALFAESSVEEEVVDTNFHKKTLSVIQDVTFNLKGKEIIIKAKMDTGALSTSIDSSLAKQLELKMLPEKQHVQSASGESLRPIAVVEFTLGGIKISSIANITDRSKMKYPMIVGRRDLGQFLIDSAIRNGKEEAPELVEEES